MEKKMFNVVGLRVKMPARLLMNAYLYADSRDRLFMRF